MKIYFFLALGLIGLTGCNPEGVPVTTTTPSTTTQPSTTTEPNDTTGPPVMHAPDNTAVNERDRDSASKTPIDQDETTADVNRTAEIRQRVVAAKDFSIDAQNIKIITAKGKVTLKGPVKTADEKDRILAIAHDVAGAENVTDEIEVANP